MKKITILHVFPDDKFFDSAANYYDGLEGIKNRYIFYSSKNNYQFKYVKYINKVRIVHNILIYIRELRKKDVDIVLFHRMVGISFLYALLLRKKTKTIWWAWGYDIYCRRNHLPPIVPLELFKPLTKQYVETANVNIEKKISYRIESILLGKLYSIIRKKAISRVNLIMPCIPIEFDLIKQNYPFFYGGLAINPLIPRIENRPIHREKPGNILVGNSLSYENNHLDVFEYLYHVTLDTGRQYIIPVSYGNDFGGADNLIKKTHFKNGTAKWLKDFIPKEEYITILNTVSHAVFGVIRQQALGNIFTCFIMGIKVYLYKNSVIAQQFRRDGYIFFTIEDDLNETTLYECLSEEESYHNYKTYVNSLKGRGQDNVYRQLCKLVNKA